jgi:enoyl-CoA hydratase
MDVAAYSFFKVDLEDGVATVAFNRPENGNKWARADEPEVFGLIPDLTDDDRVKVVVLTGSGDTFGGGAHHSDDPFEAYDYYDRSLRLFGSFMNFDKPLLIAINGTASGSGLTLAMFGDIVIAERHVRFADAHVLGGVVSATGPFLWPPNMGLLRAKRYLLTGDPFSAEEALEFGLITEVVDSGKSVERAHELATRIAALRPSAVQGTKRALNQWLRVAFDPVFRHALSLEFMRFPADLLNYGADVKKG